MVVFPLHLSMDRLKERVLQLHQLWQSPFKVEAQELQVTASVVVTVLDDPSPEDFQHRIAGLLCQAKSQGKNQILFV